MIGVILNAYGAPNSLDNLESYFSHMLKGKTPPPQMMEAITKRFRDLGTVDPLSSITKRQAKGIEYILKQTLNEEVKVYNSYTHTSPFINEAIEQMLKDGVTKIITLAISPVYSKNGTGAFQVEVRKTLQEHKSAIPVIDADGWNTHSALVNVLADRVQTAINWLPKRIHNDTAVLFTVHSQPLNPEVNEIYVKQFKELAEAIASKLHLPNWKLTYRSLANKETWLGPEVRDVIRQEALEGTKGIVTCELLSVTSDIESLYEIGEECHDVCKELNLEFVRSEFPIDSFDFILAIAEIVKEKLLVDQYI